MKNLVKEKAFKNFISSILIMVLLIGGYYFPIGKAEEVSGEQNITLTATPIPSNVKIVENIVEKEKLLGTTFEKAKVNYPLGIASEFSIFAKENVNFTGADVEGRVAAGGSVTATTDYEFQIGWKNTNDELADVIVGNGPIENVALTFGADDEGNVIDDDKKVAVSTNVTNMNYSDFSDEELTKMVASDLIDFENAFEYYKQLSLAFTNMGNLMSNEVSKTEGEIVGNFTQLSDPNPTGYSRFYGEDLRDISDTHGELYTVGDAIVLSGTNSKLNVFSIDADEIRNYRKKGIVLDVPNNSDVILNIEGDIIEYDVYAGCRGIFYPLREEEIANIDTTNEDIVYVRKNNDTQLLKSGDGTYKIFKRLNNGEIRGNTPDTDSNKVLINATDATKIATSAFPCSILAPNADVTLEGYMPGNLICKSYTGTAQFGTSYYNGATTLENSFKIDVKKIDSETKNEINGAQLEILDLQGNSLYKWTSGQDISITLNEGEYILKEISAGDSYENVVNKESTFTVKGITYVDDDNSSYSYNNAKITLGTEVKETTLVEHTEDWVSNYYESNIVSDTEDITSIQLSNTVELNNNEKIILENTSDNSFRISKYDSTGNLILEKDVTGPLDITNIVNTEVTDNIYTWFAESNTGLYYTFTYNVSEDSFNFDSITPITINNIEDILGSSNYKSKATSDGGIIAYNIINKNGTYKIDGKNTESGKDIIYIPCNDVNTYCLFITVKFNSNGKVQWANFFETDINLVSFSPEKILETEDGFVMAGGLGGDLLYIDSKENTSRKDFIRNKDDLFSTSDSLGRLKPFLIKIDNTGKICYKDYICERELNKDFGGIYKNFSAIKISNGEIYAVINSLQLANTGKVISYTKCKFPITWEALYSGVSNTKNIRKVSFEVNTNDATTLTDKDLYVIVAENNGEPFKWIEFLNWTKTQNGDRIETDVPIVKEFYPYYTRMDHYINYTYNEMDHIKFEPHFYRQNLEDQNDTAVEVYDIDINNIKVHWYTTQDKVTRYTAQNYVYTTTTPSEIIIENNHITTNVTITKTDKETNASLPLATYGLYNSNGELIETKTTNSDGTLTFDNNKLNVGDYYIQEIEAPEGYKLSTEKITFTVTKTEDFTFNLKNEKNKVEIEKIDQDGNILVGAELKVEDMQGNQIAKWTTSSSSKVLKGLEVGTYRLIETFTPTGYVKGEDIIFTINNLGEIYVNNEKVNKISIQNILVKGTISITKTGDVYSGLDIKNKILNYTNYLFKYNKQNLEGVTFELYATENISINGTLRYSKDEKIGEATTNERGIATFENLPLGNYYAVEKQALNGYITDKTPIYLGLAYANNTTPIIYAAKTMDNELIKASVNMEKTKKGTTTAVQGAVYGLYNKNVLFEEIPANTLLSTVITDENGNASFDIELPVGDYYVKELESPDGFVLSDEIKDISVTENNEFNLKFEDDYTKVQISKVESGTSNPVIGATLELEDSNGNVISTWVTDEKVYTINELPAGEYVIIEKVVAPGYTTAENKKFTVTETSDVQNVVIEEDYTKLEISKISADTKEFVPGATLQIFDENNQPVLDEYGNEYKWITNEEPHSIEKLPIGNYVLKEIVVPQGYVTAADIAFTVQDINEVQSIIMEEDVTKVELSKIDIENNTFILGATLQIFDENNQPVLDENGNEYKWVTSSESKVIKNLPVGKYKLVEVIPASGYIKADDIDFEVIDSSDVVNVVMKDDFTKLGVSKVDSYGNAVEGAILQIIEGKIENNSSNLDKNTEISNEYKSKEEENKVIYEWTTTVQPEKITRKLEVGKTYTLVEKSAPAGYIKSENIEFSVDELGQIILDNKVVENIVITDEFATGTIKITKTAEILKGVTKVEKDAQFEELEEYQFTYEDGTLYGVTFELYAAENIILNGTTKYVKDEKIGEGTTNEEGIAIFENINLGSYYFIEKQTNEGYEINKNPVSLVLAYDEKNNNEQIVYTTTFKNDRKHASIKVIKLQKGSETRLENIEFGLYNKNELCGLPADTLLSVAKTNIYGEAVFSIDIPVGEYYVKEIKTIDGYILSDEKQEINFTESKDFELIFENDYTKVKIKKVNEQNELIENAKLQLQDMNGNIIEEWTTTTENGYRIDAKLVAGHKYKLVEIEAPQGYNKADDIEFTVNTDGKLNVVKMVDTEKLSEKIPQTGNKTNIPFIIIICIVAYFGIVNAGKLVYISIKNKGN